MSSKLDYLKKYLSKSNAKQLQSQMEKGEGIKIQNSTKKRRRKQVNQSGIIVLNPEREPARVRDSQSSDTSDADGPVVVSYRDDSRETMDRKWNPINSNDTSRASMRHDSDGEQAPSRRRHDSDSDLEVNRRQTNSVSDSQMNQGSDSDIEVERKSTNTAQHSRQRKRDRTSRWSRDDRNTPDKLSCAVLIQASNSNDTVYRDKKGHRIDNEADTSVKDEAKLERDAKFHIMKSGIVQANLQKEKVEHFAIESQKELARYKGDESMNEFLKSKQLVDDPLIKMKMKKAKKSKRKKRCKPTYQGNFPSNRFNIRPGYRWDGVDRSSGYEKERFRIISDRKADVDEFYKWSCEDM